MWLLRSLEAECVSCWYVVTVVHVLMVGFSLKIVFGLGLEVYLPIDLSLKMGIFLINNFCCAEVLHDFIAGFKSY